MRRGRRRWRCAALAAVAGGVVCVAPAELLAQAGAQPTVQDIELRGRGDPDLDERLERILARDPLLITTDRVLPRAETIERDILILDANVAIEATVRGEIVSVDANLFLRPSARIEGDIVNIGGGFYRSQLATVTGEILDAPLAPYEVVREDARIVIERRREGPGLVALEGPLGFSLPTYDRVNGVTLGWGAALRPALPLSPELSGRVFYFSERGEIGGRGTLSARFDTASVTVGAERHWVTNERWIKSDAINTLTYALKGDDRRDYYDAIRYFAEYAHPFKTGEVAFVARIGALREDASSLAADDPWSLLEPDSVRPNLPVQDGVITSALLGADALYVGATSRLQATGTIELAGEAAGGDFSFGRFVADAEWATQAFRDHTLVIETHVQGPLPGTDRLPLQRWSFVGGSGTLNVLEEAQFRGDRVIFVENTYRIPLPRRFDLPLLGRGALELLHAAGMAWSEAVERDLEHELGLQLRYFALYARVLTNPADTGATEFAIGLKNPFGAGFPWERK